MKMTSEPVWSIATESDVFRFLETRVLGRWGSMGRLILATSQLIRVDGTSRPPLSQ